jgi:transcriptional regulator with XRE-family HTH domain
MYYSIMDFSEWIVSELERRGWSRSEAARRGDISPSMFDKVINGHSKPGLKFIEGIAKAFSISPDHGLGSNVTTVTAKSTM